MEQDTQKANYLVDEQKRQMPQKQFGLWLLRRREAKQKQKCYYLSSIEENTYTQVKSYTTMMI